MLSAVAAALVKLSAAAAAVSSALEDANIGPDLIGYVNAHGSATSWNDPAEAAGLHSALGEHAARVPISSTKSVHGHALDASGLLELVVTVLALRAGQLPVNAGFLAPDPAWGDAFQVRLLSAYEPTVAGRFGYAAPFSGS